MLPPRVAVIVPCLNEAKYIVSMLDGLIAQVGVQFAVVLADGGSTDGTLEITQQYCELHPELRLSVVHNEKRSIPAGLNCAIRAAVADIIIRMDAHSIPAQDYVHTCIETLKQSGAAVVGGVWQIRPGGPGPVALAIALAVSSRFGAGGAHYRHFDLQDSIQTDTVPFGCFKRDTWTTMGGFDEKLLSNEDYDFNFRVMKAGGVILLNPRIQCVYHARESLRGLAKQYIRYGWWKAQMLKRHPASLKFRQMIPAAWVLASVCLPILGLLSNEIASAALIAWLAYFAAVTVATISIGSRGGSRVYAPLFASYVAVHFAWGVAFWFGLLQRHNPEA